MGAKKNQAEIDADITRRLTASPPESWTTIIREVKVSRAKVASIAKKLKETAPAAEKETEPDHEGGAEFDLDEQDPPGSPKKKTKPQTAPEAEKKTTTPPPPPEVRRYVF